MERRITRAPQLFGGFMMLLGGLIYFIDMFDLGRNMHMFVIPAIIFMGVGALFSFAGSVSAGPERSELSSARTL